MSWKLEQAPGETDLDFARRRLKVTGLWVLTAAVACALWWPAFPAIDGHGPVVLLLSGMVSGLLAFFSVGLLFMLVASILTYAWHLLEIRLRVLHALRVRSSAFGRRALPASMMLGSAAILAHAGLAGEVPTLRWVHKNIAFAADPAYAAVLWFAWVAIFLVGFIGFLAQLGSNGKEQ